MIYKSYYVSNQFEILHSIFSIILRQSIVWQSVSMTFFSFCGSALWLYILFFSACRIKHIINTHTLFLFGSNYQPVKKVWNYFFWKKMKVWKYFFRQSLASTTVIFFLIRPTFRNVIKSCVQSSDDTGPQLPSPCP